MTKVVQKRYQYRSASGIVWTEWFDHNGTMERWQEKNKLKNEYRTIER